MSLDVTHIAGPLWIGSHPPIPGHRCGDHPYEANPDASSVARHGFKTLVLCAEEYQPGPEHFPGVEVLYAPFSDDGTPPTPDELRIALKASAETAKRLRAGRKCLVTCMAGRNRSGLVCAIALAEVAGMPASQAGEVVRTKRLGALTNMPFRGLLNRMVRSNPVSCELCEAAPITRRYHEDGICWIADCKSCGVPVVVYREHGVMPPARHLKHMVGLLKLCGRPSRSGHYVDFKRRTIPQHWHAHLRPDRSRHAPSPPHESLQQRTQNARIGMQLLQAPWPRPGGRACLVREPSLDPGRGRRSLLHAHEGLVAG